MPGGVGTGLYWVFTAMRLFYVTEGNAMAAAAPSLSFIADVEIGIGCYVLAEKPTRLSKLISFPLFVCLGRLRAIRQACLFGWAQVRVPQSMQPRGLAVFPL